MEDNIIVTPTSTIIINGGNSLPGCPNNWDEAYKIEEKFNSDKGDGEPKWDFDCGFKLDFDGSMVYISSRFYPPKTHYGSTWNGTVSVLIFGKKVEERKFNCPKLEDLRCQVEEYVAGLKIRIQNVFNS